MRTIISIISFLFIFLFISKINAQQKAITEFGEEVILFSDNTWEYVNEEYNQKVSIPVNPKQFSKSEHASFLLRSKNVNIGIWLDPKKWSFNKAINNADGEYELQLKGEDLYGLIISERIEIPLESLKDIAISNLRSVSKDMEIAKQEYRIVNGVNVLFLEINATVSGMKVTYRNYYYSNANGSIQFLTYMGKTSLPLYQEDSDELLNGFVVLPESDMKRD